MSSFAEALSFRRTVRRTLRYLPVDGDIQGLLDNLGAARGRPILVLPKDDDDHTTTGRWYKTHTTDYITSDVDAGPSSQAITLCHEIGHIVLNHGGTEEDLMERVAPDIDPAVAGRVLAIRERHSYDAHAEQDAERLGTILAAEARRRQRVAAYSSDPISKRLR